MNPCARHTLPCGRSLSCIGSRGGSSDCIRLLLAHGADLEEKDVEGKTAIHWAVHPEDTKCLDQLLTFGSSFYKDYEGRTAAHRIAELGGLPAIRLLLEVRADAISDLDRNQRSPLIWAAACDKYVRPARPPAQSY